MMYAAEDGGSICCSARSTHRRESCALSGEKQNTVRSPRAGWLSAAKNSRHYGRYFPHGAILWPV